MKRISKNSVMLVLCLVASLFAGCLTGFAATPVAVQVDAYADVGEGHWAYPWVTYMTDNGYIHGYPTDENDGLQVYKPDQLITRAEFVTILYFMLAPRGDMSQSFSDLGIDDWYYEYISKAVATGYLSGYGDGTVKPNNYITREEASSIVYRAFKIEKYVNTTEFADESEISSWAYEAVMSLAELGVVVGYTGETEDASSIQPKVNIKRAEVASLLANADKFYPAQVILSEAGAAIISYSAEKGGTVGFDMFPKNVSDNLTVSISVEPDVDYTITYTKGGTSSTVTPEEFAQVIFTSDELKNAGTTVNFPNAKDGDSVTVKVTVIDNDIEGDDKAVGSETYTAEFSEAEAPTPTPTPTSAPIGSLSGGGGSKVSYTVKYVGPSGEDLGSESVTSGGTLKNIPKYVGGAADEDYIWYLDEAKTEEFNPATAIRKSFTLYAKVNTRDRVVEALRGYQAMKGQKTAATKNVLAGDGVDSSLTDASYDSTAGKWWTNDMLSVIVTNDRDKRNDSNGVDYTDMVTGSELKSTYEDVVRYVVDNSSVFIDASDTFATVPINSTNKLQYVWYFRAMIKTIDAAANDAIKAYKDALADGVTTKEQAFENFKTAAVNAVDSSIEQAIADGTVPEAMKTDLKYMALGYVANVLTNAGGLTVLKEELAALEVDDITVTKLAEMLKASSIYPVV